MPQYAIIFTTVIYPIAKPESFHFSLFIGGFTL